MSSAATAPRSTVDLMAYYLEWMGKPEKFQEFLRDFVLHPEQIHPEEQEKLEHLRRELAWYGEVYCLAARLLLNLAYEARPDHVLTALLRTLQQLDSYGVSKSGRFAMDARRLLAEHRAIGHTSAEELAWMREGLNLKT